MHISTHRHYKFDQFLYVNERRVLINMIGLRAELDLELWGHKSSGTKQKGVHAAPPFYDSGDKAHYTSDVRVCKPRECFSLA